MDMLDPEPVLNNDIAPPAPEDGRAGADVSNPPITLQQLSTIKFSLVGLAISSDGFFMVLLMGSVYSKCFFI